jgi:hypothetical protein
MAERPRECVCCGIFHCDGLACRFQNTAIYLLYISFLKRRRRGGDERGDEERRESKKMA